MDILEQIKNVEAQMAEEKEKAVEKARQIVAEAEETANDEADKIIAQAKSKSREIVSNAREKAAKLAGEIKAGYDRECDILCEKAKMNRKDALKIVMKYA